MTLLFKFVNNKVTNCDSAPNKEHCPYLFEDSTPQTNKEENIHFTSVKCKKQAAEDTSSSLGTAYQSIVIFSTVTRKRSSGRWASGLDPVFGALYFVKTILY